MMNAPTVAIADAGTMMPYCRRISALLIARIWNITMKKISAGTTSKKTFFMCAIAFFMVICPVVMSSGTSNKYTPHSSVFQALSAEDSVLSYPPP
jgi:hypothetical protein